MSSSGKSPAYRLLGHVWQNVCGCGGHSWDRINRAMREALYLAIRAGLIFDKDDFAVFFQEFRMDRWICGTEGAYACAVEHLNLFAARSFESLKSRPPFMAVGGADIGNSSRQSDRLAVGSSFWWQHEYVTVTSFGADCQSLIACTYRTTEDPYERKIKRRFRITIGDFKAEMSKRRKAAKEAKKAAEREESQ